MIKKYCIFLVFFFILSCANIDLVLKEENKLNQLKNNTGLFFTSNANEKLSRELYSFFGNNKNYDYILKTLFVEKKKNRIVKKNQVAEKVDYTLEVSYDLFYKTAECKVFSKKIITNFSFTPKSEGYNFATDRSFDKLYTASIKKNIQSFVELGPFKDSCL